VSQIGRKKVSREKREKKIVGGEEREKKGGKEKGISFRKFSGKESACCVVGENRDSKKKGREEFSIQSHQTKRKRKRDGDQSHERSNHDLSSGPKKK